MKIVVRVALLNSAAAMCVIAAPAVQAQGGGVQAAAAQQAEGAKPAKKPGKRATSKAADKAAQSQAKQEVAEGQAASPAAAIESGDDITVIGTLIAGSNATANAPVQTVSKEYLVDHGLGRIEDIFSQMPQVAPSVGLRGSESWTQGANGIDLRGLGAARTLVLVNGDRASNDLNTIPSALLKRAEILTGGASTVYGSDAIAGVVNFELNRKFNGIQFDMEASALQHKNDNPILLKALATGGYPTPPRNFFGGFQQWASLTAGKSILDGRLNISGSISFRRTFPIHYDQYDTGGCPLFYNDQVTPPAYRTNSGYYCGTSYYNKYGYFVLTPTGQSDPSIFSVSRDGSRTFRPYDESKDEVRAALNGYLQRQDDSKTANLFISSDILKDVQLDGSLFYNNYRTTGEQSIPDYYYSYNTASKGYNLVNCDNPFLGQSQAALICGTNAGKPGNFGQVETVILFRDKFVRSYYYDASDWRGVVKLSGTLVDKVRFKLSYQYSKRNEDYGSDNISDIGGGIGKLAKALQVRNVNGVPTCISKIDGSDPACVPADIFAVGQLSPDIWNYLTAKGNSISNSNQQVANYNISGTLDPYGIKSPFATAGVGFALFGEWRRNTVESRGYGAYSTWTNFSGTINVKETGGELSLPLIQDKPFFKDLTVNGGLRMSKYDGYSKVVNSWKADATWSPFDGLRFRGSFNRAIRVPVKEKLEAQNLYPNSSFIDLCAPPGPVAAGSKDKRATRYTFEQCAAGGVTRQQYDALTNYVGCNSAGFCPTTLINGGNPNLLPELSRSITAGVVVQPRMVRGLSVTVDYYDINIFRSLTWARIGNAFEYCYDKKLKLFCDMYQRDPKTGVLLFADARYVNSGITRNRGIDINITQNLDTNWKLFGMPIGGFTITAVGNRALKRTTQFGPGAPTIDCLGLFGFSCGVTPVWRNNVNVVWRIPGENAVRLAFTWRHNSGTKAAYLSSNPVQQLTPNASDNAKFPLLTHLRAGDYFDAAFNMNINKNLSIRLNAQNLLDADPPIAAQGAFNTGASYVFNTYPGYYEMLGRTIRFGITMRQ